MLQHEVELLNQQLLMVDVQKSHVSDADHAVSLNESLNEALEKLSKAEETHTANPRSYRALSLILIPILIRALFFIRGLRCPEAGGTRSHGHFQGIRPRDGSDRDEE